MVWPNAHFAKQGLFSLKAAHALACQSSRRKNYQPESRMREIRTSGSEGGEAEPNRPSLPLSQLRNGSASSPVMSVVSEEWFAAQLELADALRAGRDTMLDPQDLPGRYGRVNNAIDHLLSAIGFEAGVAGGWAVWRHGYLGRVTQDVDIVVPAASIDELLRVASVSGFDVVPMSAGLWPKLHHKETGVSVDILPEGATPGTPSHLAPTTIPHPSRLGARGARLTYIDLAGLVELKLAAGRARDESDVVELLRANADQAAAVREHLGGVNAGYAQRFDGLLVRALEQADR